MVLVRGEVLVNVAHHLRPLILRVGPTTVRNVGAQFDVRRFDSGDVIITVAHGRVDDVGSSSATPVSSGESAEIHSGIAKLNLIGVKELDRRLAWRDGWIFFTDANLVEAVRELNRYNDHQILISYPSIEALRVDGQFRTTDPDSFVASLSPVYGIRPIAGETCL